MTALAKDTGQPSQSMLKLRCAYEPIGACFLALRFQERAEFGAQTLELGNALMNALLPEQVVLQRLHLLPFAAVGLFVEASHTTDLRG